MGQVDAAKLVAVSTLLAASHTGTAGRIQYLVTEEEIKAAIDLVDRVYDALAKEE